jgi:hypothetical protein
MAAKNEYQRLRREGPWPNLVTVPYLYEWPEEGGERILCKIVSVRSPASCFADFG